MKNEKIAEKEYEKIQFFKKRKVNDESFIDAYFIPRAKSLRCWTRKRKWKRKWKEIR